MQTEEEIERSRWILDENDNTTIGNTITTATAATLSLKDLEDARQTLATPNPFGTSVVDLASRQAEEYQRYMNGNFTGAMTTMKSSSIEDDVDTLEDEVMDLQNKYNELLLILQKYIPETGSISRIDS